VGENADASNQVLLRNVYEEIDRCIGRLLERVGDEVTVFIVSGDGVGPNYSGWHLLPEVLQRAGFLATHQEDSKDQPGPASAPSKRDPIKALRDLFPKDLRKAIARKLPTGLRDSLAQRVDTANVDWSKTRAFCLPTDLEGYIRVNLKGREPDGIVQEGREYEALCDSLTASLQQLVNPLTGRPAVRQLIRTDQAFPGDRRHYLPDLIVLWAQDSPTTEVESPEVGRVGAPSPDGRSGTHRSPGFVLARGPHIDRAQNLSNAHVFDLAPTILKHFGIPRPAHIDGKAWANLCAT
jgi:predicted AlkP superfamily phosphohydrolase/phosphomutase